MRRKIRIFGLLLVLAIVAIPGAGFWLNGYMHRPLLIDEPTVVQVDRGASYSRVINQLDHDGLLGEGTQARLRRLSARLYSAFTDVAGRMSVGEYRLKPGDSLLTLVEKIERGEVMQRSVTLVEGWTFKEWRLRLAGAEGLKHTLGDLSGAEIMAQLGMPGADPEGWFAPETYFYVRGTSDMELLRRALERQRRVLDETWLGRDEDLPYQDRYQALVMASIIERETAVPAERGEIAGVFVNRLRKGMRLQTDPTVIYGMGERYQGKIGRADLLRPSPYNTYLIVGLPPTPIAMPSRASIFAALHPAATEAIFFVARGDGSHYFSRTLAEHRRAVRDYQLQRRADYRSRPEVQP